MSTHETRLENYRPPALSSLGLTTPAAIRDYAQMLYDGGLSSKSCNKPQMIAVKIAAGLEVGLRPIQAANWIMIVNGRTAIWGDAALALVRASGWLESISETYEGTPGCDDFTAVCTTVRRGQAPKVTRFSIADAKKAELWGKDGPWTQYPDRQLMWRARGWNLRDEFGDVLCGLAIAEEEMDVPTPQAPRQLSVEVNPPETVPPTTQAGPTQVDAIQVANEAMLERIANARPAWLRSRGIDPADEFNRKLAWNEKLTTTFKVTSAAQLTQAQAEQLHSELVEAGHAQEVKEVFGEATPGN